jgi:ribokinase
MAKRPRVTVLGSLNMDISVTVPKLPVPGATVVGGAARFTPGGKGANQAVAAARLGAEVRMVGCVGDDEFGRRLLANLRTEGIDADAVRTEAREPTGLAMITVDGNGENIITVAPGANHAVAAPDVAAAGQSSRDILVMSAEIPLPAITSALEEAHGAPCVLNLAPAPPNAAKLIADAGENLDWLVVNESEAAAILGRPVHGLPDAERAAAELTVLGPRHAVVTAGAAGAALADASPEGTRASADPGTHASPEGTHAIGGFPVAVVDTVGAGDTFVGALAVALAAGVPAPEALRAAAAAGAAAVTRRGAQAGMPRPADVLAATGVIWPLA